MKFAIYILVVEDTNENAELIGQLPASNVESINDIPSEQEAIDRATDIVSADEW